MPAKRKTSAPPSVKSDLARLDAMRDEDIDYSDAPDHGDDDEFWARAVVLPAPPKVSLSIRLDPSVVGWFKQQGRGYQTRINEVLRMYVAAHRAKEAADLALRAAEKPRKTTTGRRYATDAEARAAADRGATKHRRALTRLGR